MSKTTEIEVEIAYALPNRYFLKKIRVKTDCNLQTAILQSGVLSQFQEIDLRENKIGIFSRPAKLTDLVQAGDRIEIYRPLVADPKEIRRKRAEQQREQERLAKLANKENTRK